MVDAVISFAVERLGDFLIQEVTFFLGVRDEVVWLKNKLEWMQCFLKDAEEKQDGDNRIRMWVSDIRDAAYNAEDIIDYYILEVDEGGTSKRVGFRVSLQKYLCVCNKEADMYKQADLYDVGKMINALKVRIDEICRNQEIFKVRNIDDVGEGSSGTNERLRQIRRASPYEEDEHVVGFKEDVDSLISELLKKELRRCVISILGMGGLGKTTLARKLYNNSSVKENFDCYAWVSVSMEYNTQDLLRRIIKSFRMPTTKKELEMLEKMTEEDLERHLREFLEGSRYLAVIDDVWDEEAWKSLRRAFPDSRNGSRVIITTRIKAVAERSDERTYVYQLPFLKEEESWELFCKRAFPNNNIVGDETSCCPPSLETLGRHMVRKCRGLPLAIVVLGGLLSRKHHDEWHKVQEHIWRHVSDDSKYVIQILALSFNDLPRQLKLCFLYLGLFPEDFEIETGKLLKLWVAEGFIQPGEETLEEVALKYLNDLIDRSLIQVARRNWRRIAKCRVHDLLRDLAIKKAKELNFLHICEGTPLPNAFNHRRLASHLGFERFASFDYSNPCLRTLLFFNQELNFAKINQLTFIHTKFSLLRVLDLEGIRFEPSQATGWTSLPKAVGKLIHLRFLGIRDTNINELPSSMGNLRALQTLHASDDLNLLLPSEICNATQLRHLLGQFLWPFPVNNLTNLRTLGPVVVRGHMKFDPKNLIHLQELYIKFTSEEGMRFTLDSIGQLRSLQTLYLEVTDFDSFSALEPVSHWQDLLQLRLEGKIGMLPTQMHEFLPHLKYLNLDGSELKKDPMLTLEKLPNLTILDLCRYKGKELACKAGGFSQLQVLQLYDCLIDDLRVEEGGMPVLRGFRFYDCSSKMRIPDRLRCMPAPKSWDWPYFIGEWPY